MSNSINDLSDITSFKWATVTGVNPLAIRLDGDTVALALIPDSLIDPLELVVGDRVRVELSLRKCIIHGAANGGAQSGEIKLTAVATAPDGWLLCQGQSLSRAAYPRLFAAIGTTYGSLNSSSFSLPDMRGRVAVGVDTSQTEFGARGVAGGTKAETLSVNQMPNHNHNIVRTGTSSAQAMVEVATSGEGSATNRRVLADGVSQITTQGAGLGQSHNNLQPYVSLNYIIKI